MRAMAVHKWLCAIVFTLCSLFALVALGIGAFDQAMNMGGMHMSMT